MERGTLYCGNWRQAKVLLVKVEVCHTLPPHVCEGSSREDYVIALGAQRSMDTQTDRQAAEHAKTHKLVSNDKTGLINSLICLSPVQLHNF